MQEFVQLTSIESVPFCSLTLLIRKPVDKNQRDRRLIHIFFQLPMEN
jgi:hypothetical protein